MSECEKEGKSLDNFMAMLEEDAFRGMIPLKGTFELTPRCNFNCPMCYVHLGNEDANKLGRELTNDEWLRIARQAKDAGMLYLTLTGGEPMVRPHFRELYEELAQMGFLIQLYSNGYLITEETVEWLKKTPPYMMRFTMYGASNETYRHFCNMPDGYDRYVNAVRLLREAKIPLYMVSTITKENEQDFPKIVEFAYRNGLAFTHTTNLVKPVRGAKQDSKAHLIPTPELTGEELEEYKKHLAETESKYRERRLIERCGHYRKAFDVTWDGKMVLCSFMDTPAYDLRTTDFSDAWQQLNKEVEDICDPAECATCKARKLCKRCPGELAAECGGSDRVTDAYCEKFLRQYDILYSEKRGNEK